MLYVILATINYLIGIVVCFAINTLWSGVAVAFAGMVYILLLRAGDRDD